MIAYCGYACGRISINEVSTILGVVTQVIKNWFGRVDTWSKYWPPILAKMWATRFLPHLEHVHQQSINNFCSSIFGNLSGDWLQTVINVVLAAFIGDSETDTLPAPSWKWASTESQWFLVLHFRIYTWYLNTSIHRQGVGSIHGQISKEYSHDSFPDSNNRFHSQSCN